MTIFVDTNIEPNSVSIEIRGEKCGRVIAETVDSACLRLLKHLTKDDTAFVNTRSVGAVTADILSKYISVVRVCPNGTDIIKD